jgi:photosystem II stability/assembly factor-like uncharacterized protein
MILKTTDGGTTWNKLTYETTQELYAVYFTDDNTGYAVGYVGTAIRTTDGGTTWTSLPVGSPESLHSVYFLSASKGFIVSDQGYIYRTINGGNTWTVDSSGTGNTLYSVFFTDSTTGYVVGQSGTILKTGNGGSDFVEEYKAASDLFTLWPNPAKTMITITGSLSPQKELNVTIIDLKGRQVLNETFNNKNKIEMNISTLPKGAYLVKIRAEEGMEVKKLVVE